MKAEIPVLVIAQSHRAQEGLVTLLGALPGVGTIGQMADEKLALAWAMDHMDVLVVVDARTGWQGPRKWKTLQQLTDQVGQIRCMVLVSDDSQATRAWAAGADEVLLTGFSASVFYTALKHLIAPCEIKAA